MANLQHMKIAVRFSILSLAIVFAACSSSNKNFLGLDNTSSGSATSGGFATEKPVTIDTGEEEEDKKPKKRGPKPKKVVK